MHVFLSLLLKAAAQPKRQGLGPYPGCRSGMCVRPVPPRPGGGRVLERRGSCGPAVPFCPQGELVTASKAIIEKEYQPHVIVSTAGPNPFNTLTDRELEDYRREVERKQKGPEGEQARGSGAPQGRLVGAEAAGSTLWAPLSCADCRWRGKVSPACRSLHVLLCSWRGRSRAICSQEQGRVWRRPARVCDLHPCTRSPPTFVPAAVTAWSFLTDSFSP